MAWTVDKKYVHNSNLRADWPQYLYYITEENAPPVIGKGNHFLSAEGLPMPAKKNQAPPARRYFSRSESGGDARQPL
jgi:hypothetical protein